MRGDMGLAGSRRRSFPAAVRHGPVQPFKKLMDVFDRRSLLCVE
jgi:hypothetical protein